MTLIERLRSAQNDCEREGALAAAILLQDARTALEASYDVEAISRDIVAAMDCAALVFVKSKNTPENLGMRPSIALAQMLIMLAHCTPAARWRVEGKIDPHGVQYDVERARLPGGHMSDDEVANAVFMQPNIHTTTIAKERIRWLSRALEKSCEMCAQVADRYAAKFAGRRRAQVALDIAEAIRGRAADIAYVNNLQEAWGAMRMIREAIETLGPVGVLPSPEYVGPTFTHEAAVIVSAIRAMTTSTPS